MEWRGRGYGCRPGRPAPAHPGWGIRRQPRLPSDHFHVDRADLDHVIRPELANLPRVDAGAIDKRPVQAVQVFDREGAVLKGDDGMLPGTPDPVRRLLVIQVDVHRL